MKCDCMSYIAYLGQNTRLSMTFREYLQNGNKFLDTDVDVKLYAHHPWKKENCLYNRNCIYL